MLKYYVFFLTILVVILSITTGIFYEQSLQHVAVIPSETAVQLAQTITVLRPSFITAQDIDNYVKGTGLAGYGQAFIDAEKASGIGADYLLSIAIHESGWGSNYWWKYWNNCFSWGITDSGPNSEAYKVKNMSKHDAIVYIATQIKKLYLTPGGMYYRGETLSAIGYYYASDTSWANAVINIHSKFAQSLPEDARAKQWVMGAKVMNGDAPAPQYFTSDYWTKPLTREELAIILWRINGK